MARNKKTTALQQMKEKMAAQGWTFDAEDNPIPPPTVVVANGHAGDENASLASISGSDGNNSRVNGKRKSSGSELPPAIAQMKAELAVVRAKKRSKKGATEMENLIDDTVKAKLWASAKIVSCARQREKVAGECLDLMDLEEYQGDDPETKANKEEWVTAFGPKVVKFLNKHRSYVQTNINKACVKWMDKNNGELPSKAELEAIINRTCDPNDNTQWPLIKWYWDEALAAAAGNKADWHTDHRHYLTISKAAPPKNPDAVYITPITEAYLVACIESNRDKWTEMYRIKNMDEYSDVEKWKPNQKVTKDADGNDKPVCTLFSLQFALFLMPLSV